MAKEGTPGAHEESFDRLLDVPLRVSVELGRTRLRVQELLDLSQGSVIDLERLAGEPVDVLVNGRPFGTGEIVVSRDRYAVRVLTVRSPTERVETLA
jgi:flagellar motor switch protein FliN/FliY